jgi:DNA-binding transcriptional regulator YiaG
MMPHMTPDTLQALRRRLGWTQRRLANELGVTTTAVSRWEQGVRAITPLAATALTLLAKEHGLNPKPHPSREWMSSAPRGRPEAR